MHDHDDDGDDTAADMIMITVMAVQATKAIMMDD